MYEPENVRVEFKAERLKRFAPRVTPEMVLNVRRLVPMVDEAMT